MNAHKDVRMSVDHLLRHNAGQMVAVLSKIFGFELIDQIEDAIQEALVKALKSWAIKGVPEKPTAWLIQVAKNHLFDQLRRDNKSVAFDDQLRETDRYVKLAEDSVFFDDEISDARLRLIFACCHPSIPKDSQIALTLKTVGGFNNREIASAFLAKKTAIDKILVRAKQSLKKHRGHFEIPGPESLPTRLDAVLKVLYLMFNEGYMATEGKELIRKDLCFEAIRLVKFLASHPVTHSPKVNALAALFLFQASRLSSRSHSSGIPSLLSEQDRTQWDRRMIVEALGFFRQSASGEEISEYHLEAEIACQHAVADSFENTDWELILRSYDKLLELRPSEIVALNRAYAFGKVRGPESALTELEALKNGSLDNYYPFHLTAAEFLEQTGRIEDAAVAYGRALKLANNISVKKFVKNKLIRVS
ncbi:MAG: sigma-70 family RNA polymerase sigma factor [Acidobacteriota bacterium]|nr:sigma-70 family RNA polymerase sigma factor [Acidobacteriota bacterium]MDH3528255.1 sigma-70 family RNA polymerase sigma factor [Acidobacteriota bacterium]